MNYYYYVEYYSQLPTPNSQLPTPNQMALQKPPQQPQPQPQPQRCLGRITKDEGFTFGDGKTKFYLEYRCAATTTATDPNQTICKGCENSGQGYVNELIPEGSQIFGPTQWFLDALKLYGPPTNAKEVFKKAVDAHNKVVDSIRMRGLQRIKKETGHKQTLLAPLPLPLPIPIPEPKPILYYQTDEVIDVNDIKETREGHRLVPVKHKKRLVYKEPITGLLFERNVDGTYKFIPTSQQSLPLPLPLQDWAKMLETVAQ